MLTRTIVLFSFGVAAVLFGVSQTEAQPGKGFGKGPGGGAGPDIKKLESDLERLLEQVEATKAQLARAKETAGGKKGGFEGKKGDMKKEFGKGKGFEGKGDMKKEFGKGKGGFEAKKGDMKKEFGKFKGDMKKEFAKGVPPFAGKKGAKLDPETIKERYAFYKKLYDELPRDTRKGKGFESKGKGGFGPMGKGGFGPKGFEGKKKEAAPPAPMGWGKGGGSGGSVEARIDRLIRELEQLRSEVKGGRKK